MMQTRYETLQPLSQLVPKAPETPLTKVKMSKLTDIKLRSIPTSQESDTQADE